MDEKDKKIFGLRRNAFFLGLVSLFNDFSNYTIQSIMPYFLSETLGIPKVGIGLIEGGANLMSSILRIFSGWLSDKLGRRKSLAVMGYALSVLTRPLFIFYGVLGQFGLGLVRVIDRIGKGFRDSPRDALLAASVPDSELGKSFGYQRAMDAMGGFLGPLGAFVFLYFLTGGSFSGDMVTEGDYTALFLVSFVIGILAVLSFIFVREIRALPLKRGEKFSLSHVKTNKKFYLFIAAVFIFGLGAIPEVLMFTRTVELQYSILLIPVAYFLYNGIFAVFSGPIGKLSDRIGERKVIAIGFLLSIPACFVLAFTSSIAMAFLAFTLMGFYSAATDGIERAFASKLIDHQHLAEGEGVLQAAIGISSLISAVIGGFLWDTFGHTYAFSYWGTASAVGLITFIYISMSDRRDKSANS